MLITIKLGFWQLHRARQKQYILDQYQQQKNQPGLLITKPQQLTKLSLLTKVCVTGKFDQQHNLLLTNKFHNHKLGYQLIRSKLINNTTGVLINLGWIDKPTFIINKDNNSSKICGYLTSLDTKQWILGPTILNHHWPRQVQRLWFNEIQQLFPYPISHRLITLKTQPINITPSRHFAYAVQWFTMAAAILLMFIMFTRKS